MTQHIRHNQEQINFIKVIQDIPTSKIGLLKHQHSPVITGTGNAGDHPVVRGFNDDWENEVVGRVEQHTMYHIIRYWLTRQLKQGMTHA